MTRQSLTKHGASDAHTDAVKLEMHLSVSQRDGGIAQSFCAVQSAERKAMIGAMKCMYWLCRQEVPHITNFSALLELAKSLGVMYLSDFCLGKNAHYTSERFMQEAVSSLGEVISGCIFNEIRASQFFALMADETTDVAVIMEVIVYARFLSKQRKIKMAFIGMIGIPDGCAATIMGVLTKICDDDNLDLEHKMVAFGRDGASVMIGHRNGVSALLKQVAPWIIATHCVDHRLALATAQAADEIPYVKKFKAILGQLYRFYSYSGVCMAGLKEIQDVLNDPRLKLTEVKDVRWLFHERAVSNLRRCLPSVIASLEREASERHDAQALGLARFVRKYEFVANLLMLSDSLPPLASLSHAMQREDLDKCLVKPLVTDTIATLTNLKQTPGEHFNSLETVLDEDLQDFSIQHPSSVQSEYFAKNVYEKYLNTLNQHLKQRFPDVELLEAFSMFCGMSWPDDHTLLHQFGRDNLQVLADQFVPALIHAEEVLTEWEVFKNSTVCSDSSIPIRSMNAHQVMIAVLEI